jgi:hypothetical protein
MEVRRRVHSSREGEAPDRPFVRRSQKTAMIIGVAIPLLVLSSCGANHPGSRANAASASREDDASLKRAAQASVAARRFTVTVSTTGAIVYQATMHYNVPDRIDLLTTQAGVPVESISIGTTNYLSVSGNPHRFLSGTGGTSFAATVLKVLKALETAHVTSQTGGRFEVTEAGPPSVAAEVTTGGGFISGITLHYPTNTTTYTFMDFNTGPPVTAPSASQIGNTSQTFSDGSPVQKCNRDGSIPTGADVCIG